MNSNMYKNLREKVTFVLDAQEFTTDLSVVVGYGMIKEMLQNGQ